MESSKRILILQVFVNLVESHRQVQKETVLHRLENGVQRLRSMFR